MEILLEIALIFLLAATMFHAVRLERALGVLKRTEEDVRRLVGVPAGEAIGEEELYQRFFEQFDEFEDNFIWSLANFHRVQ